MVDASAFYLRYSPDVETVADDEAETAQGLMEDDALGQREDPGGRRPRNPQRPRQEPRIP